MIPALASSSESIEILRIAALDSSLECLMDRLLVGLAVGSGLEGVDAVAVRVTSIGLDLAPTVVASARVVFPPVVRDVLSPVSRTPEATELIRNVAETLVYAVRQVLTRIRRASPRDVFAAGLLDPARSTSEVACRGPRSADRVAEQTGLTIVHGFRHRDRAAGGAGHPITAAADCLLFRSPQPDSASHSPRRGVVGAASSPAAKCRPWSGFEAGPGNQLLDALVFHGNARQGIGRSRREEGGAGPLPGAAPGALARTPAPHAHAAEDGSCRCIRAEFPPRGLRRGPATQRRAARLALHRHAPRGAGHRRGRETMAASAAGLRQVLVTGGGVRNGFLWQLVAQHFPDGDGPQRMRPESTSLARNAAASAVLAALPCDGVAGNLPVLTGAAGGRLLGHFAPGDGRNWARVATWVADQTGEIPAHTRAA